MTGIDYDELKSVVALQTAIKYRQIDDLLQEIAQVEEALGIEGAEALRETIKQRSMALARI